MLKAYMNNQPYSINSLNLGRKIENLKFSRKAKNVYISFYFSRKVNN